MSCSFGDKVKITIFGQSHSTAIGVVIDGLPAGIPCDMNKILTFMQRRAPGRNAYSTPRQETDTPEILSGIVDGCTCGAPICAVIHNNDRKSTDYEKLRFLPRPSHADFAAFWKHEGYNDIRGGGNFSGRMTAPLCFAGALAKQILASQGITIGAHISAIAGIADKPFDPVNVSADALRTVEKKFFPVQDDEAGERMRQVIEEAKANGDSVGGVIECAAVGVPAGIGDPIFDGVENKIAQIVFGIPAVKGIEFGSGFASSTMRGSEHNDAFFIADGEIKTTTNNHGGILGGLTSGMPIVFRAAIKPTPSIGKPQQSVNLQTMQPQELIIGGRHDPCIVPRAVPCMEAAMALALLNLL